LGDIAFGSDGEWREGRGIWVQYHDVKGFDLEQFRGPDPITVSILAPDSYENGAMIYPYTKAHGTPTSRRVKARDAKDCYTGETRNDLFE
jgi:hypothetical protein